MKTTSAARAVLTFFLIFLGCRRLHPRPENVPSSAVWAEGTFIDCHVDTAVNKNRCTVYQDDSGEILADGLFETGYPPRAANEAELHFAGYHTVYIERGILLVNSEVLSLVEASERDPTNRLINERLKSLSSSHRGPAIDCGRTPMNKPDKGVSGCAKMALDNGKPFYIRYLRPGSVAFSSYGLAGDGEGHVYEVIYDLRGLLNFGLSKNAHAFDDAHIRVTTCLQPVAVGETEEGILACIQPINERESALAAQQKPIDTTICAILEHPSAFNNKMVRVHGYVSGNFEYSELGADACSNSIWFVYGNGEGPPGLVAYVGGGAWPGAEDAEGRLILPIPVKVAQDSGFRRFEKLMRARVKADERSEKENPNSYVFHRVSATFTGRIDGVPEDVHAFHLKRKDMDRADFLGFGQMGLFDAQFILHSVENDAVLEAFPPNSS